MEIEAKPKIIPNKKSKSKIMISQNSEVIQEAYEGLDAKDFPAPPEEKTEVKKKPAAKKKAQVKKKVIKMEEKKEEKSPIDPGEAEALKLYNEAVSKGINPADIGTQAGDIVSGSDKKSQKVAEPEPEVVKEQPKENKKQEVPKSINSGLDDDAINLLHDEANKHSKEAKKDAEALQTAADDKVSQAEAEAFAQAQAIVAAGGTQADQLAAVDAVVAKPAPPTKPTKE